MQLAVCFCCLVLSNGTIARYLQHQQHDDSACCLAEMGRGSIQIVSDNEISTRRASSGIGPAEEHAPTRAGILLVVYGHILLPAMAAVRFASGIHLEAPDVLSYSAVLAARMQAASSSARRHADIFRFVTQVQVQSLSGQLSISIISCLFRLGHVDRTRAKSTFTATLRSYLTERKT